MGQKQYNFMLIDDHALFRSGLRMLLEQSCIAGRVIESGSLMDGVAQLDNSADLILLDVNLPGLNGTSGIKVIRERYKSLPIVMLSAGEDPSDVSEAQALGANGYLCKSMGSEEIINAVEQVLQGNSVFLEGYGGTVDNAAKVSLTARQLEVLMLLCQGMSNKRIARELTLSENTVRIHVSNIIAVLNAKSRSEAILNAIKYNIVNIQGE